MESMRIKFEGTLVGGEKIERGVSKKTGGEWERLSLLVEGDDGKTSVFVSCFGGVKKEVEGLMLGGGERVVVEFDVVCNEVVIGGESRWFTNLNLVSCERVHGVGVNDRPDEDMSVGDIGVVGGMFEEEISFYDDLPF